ncbi:TetR family transcriptional regulator [Streptomyces tateyamensis]|uniref:TetR family transcriptional regulator n=1 Tax=Streptomyces tateyamensis TaxID=565073 RepID=A0A2V4P408_9ACTN|nr:TetR/AcrR family transcriptional regulator [Streptomyces tateyamensis]PYC84746.1 TetR family transcriptional regulator [Streptomyces tateyamensis]
MSRRSAEERREELIEAAIRVMIRDGVARTTTRAIVGEAGLPLGAFHYCFRSKEELLQSVIERIMVRALAPAVASAVAGAPVATVVHTTLGAYWERIRQAPDEHLLTYELTQYALRQPELAELARRQYRHYLDVSQSSLETMAELAGIEWTVPAPVLARFALGVLDGLTLTWLLDRDDALADAALAQYADYLLSVARPREP